MSDVVIQGIGWVNVSGWGCVRQELRTPQGAVPPWKDPALFPVPPKNMGRFSAASRLTLCACVLALRDAGLSAADGVCRDMGLIGTNEAGSLVGNRAYFADYLAGGRALARSNLFVYTLPSSPLAEASIHFGFQGPMLYIGDPAGGLAGVIRIAAGMVASGDAGRLIVVSADEAGALACVVAGGVDGLPVKDVIGNGGMLKGYCLA